MRNRLCLAGLTLAAALLACNSNTPPPSPPTIDPLTEAQAQPSGTLTPHPLPVDLPTYTPTSTPSIARARPKASLVNCRFGPGTVYSMVGELKEGQSASIAGINSQGTWYYIEDPGNPDGHCWVAVDFVETTGNVEALPIVNPPAASVTKIAVTMQQPRLVAACDQFPQVVYFSADITTNGPALVTYRWEVSTGVSSVNNTIAYEEASTQTISDYYQIASPNDYWISMHVLDPNDISEKADFQVICNP